MNSRFFHFGEDNRGGYHFDPRALPENVRLLGNGQLGGKARGLLFVIDHLRHGGRLTDYDPLIGFPDSFIITTDVYDEFMEENRLGESVLARCAGEISTEELQARIVAAHFPDEARARLAEFIAAEHRPLVVRSSSVMEDNPNHSFAGIYLSEFLGNTGSDADRLEALVGAVKRVYASTFGRNARAYRKRHGLPWEKEKMAILVQNMIGRHYPHSLFYPLIGGVAFSLNFYPWSDRLRPEDGVVRLVVGVGTRAVGREYARVFSPVMPGLRPEGSDTKAIIRYSQETVDVLDMQSGQLGQRKLHQLNNPLLAEVCSVVSPDGTLYEPVGGIVGEGRYVATFNRFIARDDIFPFTSLVRELLAGLEGLFELPVDIEFAVDFPLSRATGEPRFYLLQARPLGGRPEHRRVRIPQIPKERILISCGNVLGNGKKRGINDLIFVDPRTYDYTRAGEVARRVGEIDQTLNGAPYILIGPGRWGTTNPQLGVPVQYGEIAGAEVIVEMATESFAPELSYGTHFYADMVASGVLYLPFREEEGDQFNRDLLSRLPAVASADGVLHVRAEEGFVVYADGAGKRGVIALSR